MNAAARRTLASAINLHCWRVRWDNQIGLDMNFGRPFMEVADLPARRAARPGSRGSVPHRHVYLKGTHWLWIGPGLWRIDLAEGLRVRSTSSRKSKEMVCARLCGEKLHGVRIDPESGRTVFLFDLGGTITVAARGQPDEEDDELWTLHAPRNRFVAVHARGRFSAGSTRAADPDKHALRLSRAESELVVVGSRA